VALDLARDLRRRATDADADLWGPKLWLTLENTSRLTPRDRVTALEQLARQFPEVPPVATRLANAYAELGWIPEHAKAVEEAARRFPNHVEVLEALLGVEERRGRRAEADRLAARIRALEPASEIELRRAVSRHDWPAAIAELGRIGTVRPERQDIARRLEKLQIRAGVRRETMAELERALAEEPTDADARMALADTRLAAGHGEALGEALADALRTGSESRRLRSAIELVEGTIALEPFRRDGLAVIRDAEQSGVSMPGTAARLLDYVALWVEPDGSARMLEHEIIRVQSREGIAKHTEQNVPNGTILRMRTVKRDGSVFEPEIVAGKPTVTMPHLEVGDYVETEFLWLLGGDGKGGRAFLSPRWMFQERNVSYHLSEFVLITPANQPLQIETTGQVPEPELEQAGALTVRRWRVRGSVGVPDEVFSPDAEEYLPSVRAGWGIDLDERLRRLMDTHRDELPLDPRLERLAAGIVAGTMEGLSRAREDAGARVDPAGVGVTHSGRPAGSPPTAGAPRSLDERARRLYRWVVDNVQPGPEKSGPRIITGKTGDRLLAFIHLCKLAGLDARLGVIQDRLSPEPTGPFSEATKHSVPAARLATEHGPRWLIIADRYAPYGYLPSSLRGQPAVLLDPAERLVRDEPLPVMTETTNDAGSDDRVVHSGDITLALDGSAEAQLTQVFHGRYAIEVRSRLAKEPESRWRDVLEAELLGVALPGARIRELEVEHLSDLDEPVRLVLAVELPSFARLVDGALEIDAPFLPSLGRLGALQSRQTPLVLPETQATRAAIELRIRLPKGAHFAGELAPVLFEDEGRRAEVADRTEGGSLELVRSIELPAGRVAPADYARFRDFVLAADEALHRTVRVPLPGR
jgi:tetratricopeptide (TPR) repeat protein